MSQTSALAWIRFLRLPAVLTVPGDVLVGAALVGAQASLTQVVSVCAAYLFGMALNDVVDFPSDCKHRPERPLPKGEIPKQKALSVCGLLALLAFFSNPGLPVAFLLLLISAYTVYKDNYAALARVLMGFCRGLALWIGAGSPPHAPPTLLIAMGLWIALITWITFLADNENREIPLVRRQTFGLTVLWYFAPAVGLGLSVEPSFMSFLPWLVLVWIGTQNFRTIKQQGFLAPKNTGVWLSMLIPLQSCFLFSFGHEGLATGVLLLYPCLKWSIQKIQIS